MSQNSDLKHRWSLSHNYLAGITAGDWFRLLRDNGFAVDPVYWHRAAFVTLASLMNSASRWIEERRFGEAIAAAKPAGPPLFVLGHWRNGTTHLHNLLALDPQFAFANTYQVTSPHTFLSTESINTRLFKHLVPPKRPMDNMALSFQSPQEDEFALLLTTLVSPYLGATFPRREDHYSRFLTFRDATAEEIDTWKRGFVWFVQKLTLKDRRPLVLKSPPHTARIRLLLEIFPEAHFVHIHREPYTVFQIVPALFRYGDVVYLPPTSRPCLDRRSDPSALHGDVRRVLRGSSADSTGPVPRDALRGSRAGS